MRPSFLDVEDVDLASGGNRFDSPDWGTLYFATELSGCFAETLARFVPSPQVRTLLQDDSDWADRGFMAIGAVPADWRHRRVAVRVTLDEELRFLDVEATETHVVLTDALAEELDALEYGVLDVATVRGPDRRVTRAIAEWAFDGVLQDGEGEPAFAGLRYVSRLGDFECWAVFDRVEVTEQERRTISRTMPGLQDMGRRFGIDIF